jgi:hypothetical protein
MIFTPFYSFTRPADTTAYASGDLVANSTTAASVVPLSWGLNAIGRTGLIRGARLYKSNKVVTAAVFKLHLFGASPGTPTNGDNGAIVVASAADYIGSIDFDMTSTGFAGGTTGAFQRASTLGIGYCFPTLTSKLYGLLAAGGAYTPISAETFTATLEIEQTT